MSRHLDVKWIFAALLATIVAVPGASANLSDLLRGGNAEMSPEMEAGLAAIDAGAYETAIAQFESILESDPANAEAYNQLGYINRRLQKFDEAFTFYNKALSIDPKHTGAHHYIGEAYLEIGDLAMAEHHLGQLGSICLIPCSDLLELRQAVDLYKANNTD